MITTRRMPGLALAAYGLATAAAMIWMGIPGGEYDAATTANFLAAEHFWSTVALAYVGALGALALLPATLRLGELDPQRRDLVRRLGTIAAAVGVVGWFLSAGIAVAATEGGTTIRDGLPLPVAHTLGEIGVLLAVCAPAFSLGLAAIVLARSQTLPTWLRVFTALAGLCGILAAFYFTEFVFLLWTLVAGIWLSRPTVAHALTTTPVS